MQNTNNMNTGASNVVDMTKYQKPDTYAYVPRKLSEDKTAEILDEVKKNKGRWWDAFGMNLQSFRDDKYFYTGVLMWDAVAYQNYLLMGKVPYTFNLLQPIVQQLQGEIASMQPSIALSPANHEKADPQLLILMTDFLRGEMYHHKAADAYNACFLNQCVGGWGILELETEYQDAFTFSQEILVKSSPDPLLVGFDPTAKVPTKCDSAYQFKDYFMDKDDFKATFNREPPPPGQMLGTQRQFLPMIDSNTVIVTDYYRREYKTKTLVQLTNHENYSISILEKDVPLAEQHYIQLMTQGGMDLDLIPPLVIANRRKTKIETIHCYKCVFDAVLEHKVWPSKFMPFVFVDAFSTFQDGRQYTRSFIKGAKDAQMSYNYCLSEIYNGISRTRREQVWMTREQAKNHEEFLRYPDRQQSHGEYNYDSMVPSGPIFRGPEELPESIFNGAALAKQAVYDALGIMPVNGTQLPNNLANATVGRIITQGNLTFAKLLNNLFDAMQQIGETFLDLVPKIYDTERIVNLVDATGSVRSSTVNTVEQGQQKNNLLDIVYHLEVKPMASFAIQQQELRQNLFQLAQLDIQNAPLISDLIAGTLETPIAPLLVKRLRTLVPPNVIAAEQGLPAPPPTPPNPQVQLVEANIQKLNAEAQLAQAKAAAAGDKNTLSGQQMQQKANEAASKYQLEQQKLVLQSKQMHAKSTQDYINGQAEVQKAQLDHDAKIIPAMAKLHQASMQKTNVEQHT